MKQFPEVRTVLAVVVAVLCAVCLTTKGFAQNSCGTLDDGSTSEQGMGSVHYDGIVYNWGDNSVGQLGNNSHTNSTLAVPVLKGQYAGTLYFGDIGTNKAVSVVTSDLGRVALTADGLVYTWGSNGNGQLGLGSTSPSSVSTPVKVVKGQYPGTTYLGDNTANKITAIIAGSIRYYALASDGRIFSWGDNGPGSGKNVSLLGDGSTVQRNSPITVLKGQYAGTTYLGDNSANKMVKIAANAASASGLGADGLVYSWGANPTGQMGDNTNTDRSTPVKVLKGQYPGTTYLGDVSTNKVVAITMGYQTMYALTQDGSLYAWGLNDLGEIGNNSHSNVSTPVRVRKGQYSGTLYLGDVSTNQISKIAASDYHMLVICNDGLVYSWGWNNNGQLADGTTNDRSTPVKVLKGDSYPGTTYLGDNPSYPVTHMAGGGSGVVNFSVFLTGGDCKVYGAGTNSNGELGNGNTNQSTLPTPAQVNGACGSKLGQTTVATGTSLLADGVGILYAWGDNSNGQIGDGTTTDATAPQKMLMGQYAGINYLGDTPTNPIMLSAAGNLFSLAVDKKGVLYSVGDNGRGELGIGNTTDQYSVMKVLKGQYPGTTYMGDDTTNKVTDIAAMDSTTIVLTGDGYVYGFGRNALGQVGDNTTTDKTTPVRVRKGEYSGTTYLGDNTVVSNRMKSVTTGAGSALALAADGTVYAWGMNENGQLGNGLTTMSSTPVRVRKGAYSGTAYLGDATSNTIVSVAASGLSFYALDNSGAVWSWGDNSQGQLGDGTSVDRSTPVRVVKGGYSGTIYLGDASTNRIVRIVGGGQHVIALDAAGMAYAWGKNANGQLGDGTTTNRTSPVRVLKGAYPGTTYMGDVATMKITDVSASDLSTIYVTSDCSVYGIGNNAQGQLGNGTTTNSTSIVRAITPVTDLTLPVTLTDFRAVQQGSQVELEWRTASEVNSYAMEIERRIGEDGSWQKQGSPVAGHGTSNMPHDYRQRDDVSGMMNTPGVVLYYRIKSIDLEGTFGYSVIREVNLIPEVVSQQLLSRNMPNPFSSATTIGYSLSQPGRVDIGLYNGVGERIRTLYSGMEAAGTHQLSVNGSDLTAGTYYYRMTVNGELVGTRQMTVAK